MQINRIYCYNFINLVAPKNNAYNKIGISRENIHRIAFHPEVTTIQLYFVSGIQTIHQRPQKNISNQLLPSLYFNYIARKIIRISDTIQTRNR